MCLLSRIRHGMGFAQCRHCTRAALTPLNDVRDELRCRQLVIFFVAVVRMEDLSKHQAGRATYQDVLDAPAHMVAEVIDGVLYTFPRPAVMHARASSGLGVRLGGPFDYGNGGPGGWWILDEPEMHLGEEILVPDLAGWRRERVPELPNAAFMMLTPDWLCEVLSPATRAIDLGAKRQIYAREGVPHMWLIDPPARSLEAFELRDGHWALLARRVGHQQVSLPPFEAVSFFLGDLWTDSMPPQARSRHPRIHDGAGATADSI